ncbi:MAG: glycosyltransferase family protein [Bacteroidales bacterium]|jgi:uncharacterized protein (TIGR00661 family)|nr:glycosyltransferase family protein [Bacteroidales bacterium]
MNKRITVLVTPLNWGLGHATRTVPVIEHLVRRNARVVIAADKRPLDFLKLRFPDIEFIRFPGFEPRYPNNSMMAIHMARSFSRMWQQSRKSHHFLQEIVAEYEVDIIISDNRFECYSKHAYNVFVTHQLQIQTEGWQNIFKSFINKINYGYIKKYDELWIPDVENPENNLSGKLSHVSKFPVSHYHFIGPLSRFKSNCGKIQYDRIDLLVILSGPEPQRTILEDLITNQAIKSQLKTTIVQGKTEENKITREENITFISHADDTQMAVLIQSAEMIISRPGYTTIMDLCVFGKKAIFIPTPGQTEQAYLAKKMLSEGYCYSENQKAFNLERSFSAAKKFSGLPKITSQEKMAFLIENLFTKNMLDRKD